MAHFAENRIPDIHLQENSTFWTSLSSSPIIK